MFACRSVPLHSITVITSIFLLIYVFYQVLSDQLSQNSPSWAAMLRVFSRYSAAIILNRLINNTLCNQKRHCRIQSEVQIVEMSMTFLAAAIFHRRS